MWGLPPPHPFSKKRHIGRSAEWAGMLPFQRRRTMLISTREPSLAILLDTCLWHSSYKSLLLQPQCKYTGVCCIAQLPNRGWLLGFGREVFFPRHTCSVEKTENLMGGILLDYIYLYILLLCYIAIYLYIYIVIALFIYSVVCLLLYCMLTALGYYFLYIYILFLFLTSTSIFYDSGCRLSINWLFTVQRYGGSVRYQTPGDALFG